MWREGLGELCTGVEVVPDCILMWKERLGELCAGVEVVPDCIDVEGEIG